MKKIKKKLKYFVEISNFSDTRICILNVRAYCSPLGSIVFARRAKYGLHYSRIYTNERTSSTRTGLSAPVELSARDRQKYKAVRAVRGIQLLRDRYRYPHRFPG